MGAGNFSLRKPTTVCTAVLAIPSARQVFYETSLINSSTVLTFFPVKLSLTLCHGQLSGAVCAAGGLDLDSGQTIRALFRCRLDWWRFLFSLHPVDAADEQEYHKGNDEKADDGVYQQTIVDRNCARRLRIGQRCVGRSRAASGDRLADDS